ncbi:hypothetical protein CH280_04465 [Rhodococcus sp. 06-156-4C]|nr:hypothetical protein CH280_04465 [Rhodococcus sp. 06-156-4C]
MPNWLTRWRISAGFWPPTLDVDDYVDLASLRQMVQHPPFDRPDHTQEVSPTIAPVVTKVWMAGEVGESICTAILRAVPLSMFSSAAVVRFSW